MGSGGKRARAEACRDCRIRKRRCVPGTRDGPCRPCQSLSIPCSLEAEKPKIKRWLTRDSRSHGRPTALNPQTTPCGLREDQSLVNEVVSFYFEYIHNVAHTLFHQATFMKRLGSGATSELHLHAILAVASRFSLNSAFAGTNPRARGRRYAAEAQRLFQERLLSPSLESVQACILLLTYHGAEGESQAKHIYTGLARSHAEAISLWQIPDGATLVVQEERRRTWLSLCIISQWSEDDLVTDLHISSSANTGILQPLPQRPGLDATPARTAAGQRTWELSDWDMWLQMGGLLPIFSRTSTLLRRLSRGNIEFECFRSEAPYIAACFDEWVQNLPDGLGFTTENLTHFVRQRSGRTFLAMHISYHHYRQMLYFPFLDACGQSRGNPLAAVSAEAAIWDGRLQCKSSANTITDIVKAITVVDDCELKYFIYAHMVVVSSCVHLHTLLCDNLATELDLARQRLILNFKYLTELQTHWPVVDVSAGRLKAFQNYCRNSASDPFAMDNWMARFLTEHTSTLLERPISTNKYTPRTPPMSYYAEAYNEGASSAGYVAGNLSSQPSNLENPEWASVVRFLNNEVSSGGLLAEGIF